MTERLLNADGTYNLGLFDTPIVDPDLTEAPIAFFADFLRGGGLATLEQKLKRWRLKEWQYCSISNPDLFLAVALVNLHYVGNVLIYAIDRRQDVLLFNIDKVLPLAKGLSFEGSSTEGQIRYQAGLNYVDFINRVRSGTREIHINLLKTAQHLPIKAHIQVQDSTVNQPLILAAPLPKQRISYTHKIAALPVSGEFSLGNKTWQLSKQLTRCSFDWTKAYSERLTCWKWASASGILPNQKNIGFNLAYGIYAEPSENAFWVNGSMVKIGAVNFVLNENDRLHPWELCSEDGRVQLSFEPVGTRSEKKNYGLVKSDFHQLYGYFYGTLKDKDGDIYRIDKLFGVTEDHEALW